MGDPTKESKQGSSGSFLDYLSFDKIGELIGKIDVDQIFGWLDKIDWKKWLTVENLVSPIKMAISQVVSLPDRLVGGVSTAIANTVLPWVKTVTDFLGYTTADDKKDADKKETSSADPKADQLKILEDIEKLPAEQKPADAKATIDALRKKIEEKKAALEGDDLKPLTDLKAQVDEIKKKADDTAKNTQDAEAKTKLRTDQLKLIEEVNKFEGAQKTNEVKNKIKELEAKLEKDTGPLDENDAKILVGLYEATVKATPPNPAVSALQDFTTSTGQNVIGQLPTPPGSPVFPGTNTGLYGNTSLTAFNNNRGQPFGTSTPFGINAPKPKLPWE